MTEIELVCKKLAAILVESEQYERDLYLEKLSQTAIRTGEAKDLQAYLDARRQGVEA